MLRTLADHLVESPQISHDEASAQIGKHMLLQISQMLYCAMEKNGGQP